MTPYYEDDFVRLFNYDCRELLPTCGEYDHVITDPLYDAETHANARTAATADIGKAAGVLDIKFASLGDPTWLVKALTPRRWALACCSLELLGDYRRAAGDRWIRSGIWDRVGGAPQFTGDRPGQAVEGIAIWHREGKKRWNRGGKRGIWRHPVVNGPERVHETQKPVSLMRELILDFTDPDETIFDPFAGSGTTGVAAKECGRKAVLVEIDAERCAIAAKRLTEASLDERIARVPGQRGKQGALAW